MKPTLIFMLTAAIFVATGCASSSDSETDSATEEKTLAEMLCDKLDTGEYAIDMVLSGDDYDTDMPCVMKASDGDSYVSMTIDGAFTEFYTVDETTYMVFADIECYQISSDSSGSFVNGLFKIGSGDTLSDTITEDGEVTEVYKSDDGETFTFVFDEESGELKSFESLESDVTTRIDINSVKWDNVTIEMPDTTDWTDISDSDSVDDKTQLKVTLYLMGIDSEDVENAGYTYDKLVKMTDSELNAAILDLQSRSSSSDSTESENSSGGDE